MSPFETATLVASAVVIAVGAPLAFFHRAIAKELGHLRTHFLAKHAVSEGPKATRRARRTRA